MASISKLSMWLHDGFVEAKFGEEAANFLLDINRYHENRLETLRENAKLLAQRARLFKPM